MNSKLFQKIANNLLTTHYGIGTNDTDMDKRSIEACIKNNTRPFEEVNRITLDCHLDRTDTNFLTPGAYDKPLTISDEYRAIREETTGQYLDDDILQCFECCARTDFVCLESGEQHHTCLNPLCGHEFMVE